jgi:plasmid maintenance system antidote protein VapI/DNA-binding NarL/FixJ family response regulator
VLPPKFGKISRVYKESRVTHTTDKPLRILLAEPDTGRRVRLREALRNVRKIETADARSAVEIDRLLEEKTFDLVTLSSSFEAEVIRRIMTAIANAPGGHQVPVILALRAEERAAPFVAEMYAKGIVGFICEPYSVDMLSEILRLAATAKETPLDEKTKDRLASGFLLGDALKQFEKIIEMRATGQKTAGYVGREFRDNISAFHDTAASLSNDELADVLIKEFEKGKPKPVDEAALKKKKKVGPAVHPGQELRDLMSARGITKEQFLSIAKIPPIEFDQILDCTHSLTKESAAEVARAIGRSGEYWLALQTKYNAYKAQLEEEKRGL